eukprot:ctg_415.g131
MPRGKPSLPLPLPLPLPSRAHDRGACARGQQAVATRAGGATRWEGSDAGDVCGGHRRGAFSQDAAVASGDVAATVRAVRGRRGGGGDHGTVGWRIVPGGYGCGGRGTAAGVGVCGRHQTQPTALARGRCRVRAGGASAHRTPTMRWGVVVHRAGQQQELGDGRVSVRAALRRHPVCRVADADAPLTTTSVCGAGGVGAPGGLRDRHRDQRARVGG